VIQFFPYKIFVLKPSIAKNRERLLFPLQDVIYSNDEGVITDEFCPMRHTISKRELKIKGQILLKHLKKIDNEQSNLPSSAAFTLKPLNTTNLRTCDG